MGTSGICSHHIARLCAPVPARTRLYILANCCYDINPVTKTRRGSRNRCDFGLPTGAGARPDGFAPAPAFYFSLANWTLSENSGSFSW
jgi:hypothetical protein